ncbi:TolC family protein [Psychroserpens burtonensis]|uniref:TolC family protein n=1 Tax=Psychroserpens burtonensis TaxID=49278 RepID=A0A5C7BJB6_9FLAO|nr:TolC family protein [Psychroserpens burtonensis]TXE20222.1 TolC family protein [Psychroserpens burtonensis]
MNTYITLIVVFITSLSFAQTQDSITLSFSEYLGYVKKFHPIAKQAELTIQIGQANLMKARGAFDPKIEVDNERKKFKNIEYFDQLNATFKVPTWYGIELKGNFEQNEGVFLNPQADVPNDGLYSAGISASLGQGFFINQRMADLRKAKFFREQTVADREILVNQILFDASLAYFNWLQAYNETRIYEQFLENSKIRFKGVKLSAENGDKAAIDSIEAGITVKNRTLGLEQARVKVMKATLELSTYLWLNDDIPIELQPNVIPDAFIEDSVDDVLEISGVPLVAFVLENHPKLRSLNYKFQGLEVDKRLKANKLLPKIDIQYNFLTQDADIARSFNTNQYKGGFSIAFPLFLRKERGDLRLAKFKLQDARFDISNAKITIQNKVLAIYRELESFETQNDLIEDIVKDYATMLNAEERKFSFGESSLFLINSREKSLIDNQLKAIELQNKYLKAKAKLFNSLSRDLENL